MVLLGHKMHKYFRREVQRAVVWFLVMLLKSSPSTKYSSEGYICWGKAKAFFHHQATWYPWCPVIFSPMKVCTLITLCTEVLKTSSQIPFGS